MSRPLKISGTDLREMSDADLAYPAHQILSSFAASNTGVGTVTVGGTTGTSIGTFTDTSRPNTIGSHPVGTTVNSSTTTFRQDLGSVAESHTRPVQATNASTIQQQSDSQIDGHILDRTLSILTAGGLGSYALQPSAPTTGGTWTSIATITDTSQSGNTTTKLWRRTGSSAPTVSRPLKVTGSGDLQEMTDSEIQQLTSRFRNRIVATGRGKYAVQATAPTSGTWVRKGNAFSDTRQQVGNVNYAGNYTGTYSTAFAGTYSRNFARVFGSRVAGYYTGYFTGYYTGFFSGTYTGYYAGQTVLNTKETPSSVSLWIRTA